MIDPVLAQKLPISDGLEYRSTLDPVKGEGSLTKRTAFVSTVMCLLPGKTMYSVQSKNPKDSGTFDKARYELDVAPEGGGVTIKALVDEELKRTRTEKRKGKKRHRFKRKNPK